MRHLILTRLALGRPDEAWLAKRLAIFESLCAPTLARQTRQDFHWVLAIDPQTPGWFVQRAIAAAPRAALVYHAGETITPDWPTLTRPFRDGGPVATTRLDSDDMLHYRFVETVQYYAAHCRQDTVIDFPVGLKVRLSDFAYEILELRRPTHFISLVEIGNGHRTVYQCAHQDIDARYPVWQAPPTPSWVEVCHDLNIYNAFKPRPGREVLRASRERLMAFLQGGPPL